jgi:hypothetical protein
MPVRDPYHEKKIAVEIKTFGGDSEVADLEQAIGQYFTYLSVISRNYPARVLSIAVHEDKELVKAGVPKNQIFLGFWSEELRQDSEFAIA